MTHPPLQVNLPESLEQASFFTTEPFTIFEMDNFVNEEFYHALVADVNARQDFDRVFKNKGDKKKLSLGGHNIAKAEASPFKTLVEYFLSEDFFNWFIRTHLPYFETKTPYHVYNKKSSEFKDLKAAKSTEYSFYNTEVHYSSITKDGFIPPHTDSPRKRLSFVFYLPAEPVNAEMQQTLGTQFYDAKDGKSTKQSFESGLLNAKHTDKFHNEHKVVRTTDFTMNKAVGFIKSDISWHAVKPNPYDYDRRAIVINMMEMEP